MSFIRDLSDEDLVVCAKANDQDAYTELYRRLMPRLRGTVLKILRKFPEEIDDCVQDVAAKIFLKIDTFRGTSKFSTWCTRLAINQALMRLRELNGCKREKIGSMVYIDHPVEDGQARFDIPVYDRSSDITDAARQASLILAKLPPKSRLVLELHYLLGMECNEIASAFGWTLGGVKSMVHHAKRRAVLAAGKLEKEKAFRNLCAMCDNCAHGYQDSAADTRP